MLDHFETMHGQINHVAIGITNPRLGEGRIIGPHLGDIHAHVFQGLRDLFGILNMETEMFDARRDFAAGRQKRETQFSVGQLNGARFALKHDVHAVDLGVVVGKTLRIGRLDGDVANFRFAV
jgi:hypothetical protein